MSTDQTPADTATAEAAPQPAGSATEGTESDSGLGRPIPQSADPIDRVVRLAPPWTIFVLAACGLLVAAGLLWAFTGRIVSVVSSPGILHDNGFTVLASERDGRVSTIEVEIGDEVGKGQVLAVIDEVGELTAPFAGNVSAVYQIEGAALRNGDAVVAITDYQMADQVVTLLSPSLVGTVVPGLPVRVELASAPASTYGYAVGVVESVSGTPLTTEEVANRLGVEPQIVASELGDQPGLLVVVALNTDPDSPSTYEWTVGDGPPFVPVQGTGANVNVILSEQHPIQVLFGSS